MIEPIKNSIQKKVIFLAFLSIIYFIVFILINSFIIEKNKKELEYKITNQRAKLRLGQLLTFKINKSHLNITHLINVSNSKNFAIHKKANDFTMKNINKILCILNHQGTFQHHMKSNINNLDLITETINYIKPKSEGISIELINLRSIILDIEKYFNEIIELNKESLNIKKHINKRLFFANVNLKEKKLHTLYVRCEEDINKIFFEASKKLNLLNLIKIKEDIRNERIFYILSFAIIAITIITLIVILKQINSILKEKNEIQKNLLEKSDYINKILDSAMAGIVIVNEKTHKIIEANKKAIEMIGLPREEIINNECHTHICPANKGKCPITDLGLSVDNSDKILLTKNGKINILKTVVKINLNGEDCLLETFMDVTELKKAQKDAEAANVAKSEFLANMTHELRTPMNAVIGFADILSNMELDEDITEMIWHINESGKNLLNLINDLLDHSKIDAGEIIINNEPFEIRCEMPALIYPHQLAADKEKVLCNYEIKDNVPEILVGDFHRVKQILNNLLSNAVKFTHSGKIETLIEIADEKDKIIKIKFSVTDSGIGVPKEKEDILFSPFTQADASTTRKYGGTGLGLSICKKITNLLGGEIGINSEAGKGSTFWFTLPFEKMEMDDLLNDIN